MHHFELLEHKERKTNLIVGSSTSDVPIPEVLREVVQGGFISDSEVSNGNVPVSLDGSSRGGIDADATKSVTEGDVGHDGW